MIFAPICVCQLDHIDQIIHHEIAQCHPRAWNEDHITFRWLEKLISEWPTIGLTAHPSVTVRWDAYKMTGKLEQENGDVAFLIDITFLNGNTLLGVGFLEAKRIYDTNRFETLKWAQLRLLSSNSSNHQLLLYDHSPVSIPYSLGTCVDCHYCPYCEDQHPNCCEPSKFSAAIVMPSLHAIAYEEKGRALEGIGHRLSEQIVLRYFRGLDLDFDAGLVQRVLSGAAGGAKYLAVATIHFGDEIGSSTEKGAKERKPVKPDEASGYRNLIRKINRDG